MIHLLYVYLEMVQLSYIYIDMMQLLIHIYLNMFQLFIFTLTWCNYLYLHWHGATTIYFSWHDATIIHLPWQGATIKYLPWHDATIIATIIYLSWHDPITIYLHCHDATIIYIDMIQCNIFTSACWLMVDGLTELSFVARFTSWFYTLRILTSFVEMTVGICFAV